MGCVAIVHTQAYGEAMRKKLTRRDWLKAAFRALTEHGPTAIKAEALARALSVSKGSFYWHFKDVAALRRAMIDLWLEEGTISVIEELESMSLPAAERLQRLVEISVSERSEPFGGMKLESAIRDWARYEPEVRSAAQKTDRKRLAYLENLFREAGADEQLCKENAALLYAMLIGLQELSYLDGSSLNARRRLSATLNLLLSDIRNRD